MAELLCTLLGSAAGSWTPTSPADNILMEHDPLGFKPSVQRMDPAIALGEATVLDLELTVSQARTSYQLLRGGSASQLIAPPLLNTGRRRARKNPATDRQTVAPRAKASTGWSVIAPPLHSPAEAAAQCFDAKH